MRELISSIARLALGIVALMVATAAPAQQKPETIQLAGLKQPVDILVDHWGVPHIYAKNEADLFFAQGFNVARDRLFQMDLWRRRGLGELAEVFGPEFVDQDKAARLFLYRGDMKKEWAAYSPDAESIATQFAVGINAYIRWLVAHPQQMPYEFKLLKYQPALWSPEDVVRIRSHGLGGNLLKEAERARVVCAAGWKADEIRQRLEPPWQTSVPEGLDPCLPRDVLKVFSWATATVRLAPAATAGSYTLAMVEPEPANAPSYGSNNWVISPQKSATGRAILASDPHRDYVQPSVRYLQDLNAPTLHIEGMGEPFAPGVSFAHNEWIAYAGTVFWIDQEDLYVYQLNPANPEQYKYQGRWEAFRSIHEEIKVKGQPAIAAELKFTRHGPVIYVDKETHRAFAVRTAWSEPGASPYFVSVAVMRAKTFAEYERAVAGWGKPALNLVYADIKGNIAWTPRGYAPIRSNWDGLLPVPGDGRYEWSGTWSGAQLPLSYNPRSGYLTTSNEMNLPPDYPYKQRKLGFEWSDPSRHQRIDEVLSQLPKVSLEDSMRLQNDELSIPARRLLALLRPLKSDDPQAQAALKVLRGWNASLDVDSAAAALEEVWFTRNLQPAFKTAVLSKQAAGLFDAPNTQVLLGWLEHATAQRDKLLLSTLAAAYAEMKTLQGPDPGQWAWGKLHHNFSEHPFSRVVDEAEQKQLDVGPLETGGSAFTVNASSYRASNFLQLSGPSVRMVLDVGNWDNSRAVNYPGESGDPNSSHYRDLAPMWQGGTYFPLLYSRQAVEKATEKRIRLVPYADVR
jgi:penicillin G amidase